MPGLFPTTNSFTVPRCSQVDLGRLPAVLAITDTEAAGGVATACQDAATHGERHGVEGAGRNGGNSVQDKFDESGNLRSPFIQSTLAD